MVVMSSTHPDRIKLSTAATTIVRPPVGRGKSITGTAAFWAALPELSSREQPERSLHEELSEAAIPSPIPIPSPGAGPVPWRDVVTSSIGVSSSPTRRSLLNSIPSSKAVTGTGDGGGGGGGYATRATSFRRPGVVSAPVACPPTAGGALGAGAGGAESVADADRGRLPMIRCGSRSVAASASGGAPSMTALPSALKGTRRSFVSLPSIHGAAGDGVMAAAAAAAAAAAGPTSVTFNPSHPSLATTAIGAAGGGAAGGGGSRSDEDSEEDPVVVSYVPSRPGSAKRSAHRALSRPSLRVIVASSAGGPGDDRDVDDGASAEAPAATSTTAGQGRGGALKRGIWRLFGKDSSLSSVAASHGTTTATATAAAAATSDGAAPTLDDTARQDDTAEGAAAAAAAAMLQQRSGMSVVQLAREHKREQERVNRVRSTLLGGGGGGGGGGGLLKPILRSHDSPAPAAAAAAAAAVVLSPVPPPGPPPPPPPSSIIRRSTEDLRRALRSGKSFTQLALEDPTNPAFKTAQQLAAVQEQLSYMADPHWREKAAEMVTMERPILMAEGWKV